MEEKNTWAKLIAFLELKTLKESNRPLNGKTSTGWRFINCWFWWQWQVSLIETPFFLLAMNTRMILLSAAVAIAFYCHSVCINWQCVPFSIKALYLQLRIMGSRERDYNRQELLRRSQHSRNACCCCCCSHVLIHLNAPAEMNCIAANDFASKNPFKGNSFFCFASVSLHISPTRYLFISHASNTLLSWVYWYNCINPKESSTKTPNEFVYLHWMCE